MFVHRKTTLEVIQPNPTPPGPITIIFWLKLPDLTKKKYYAQLECGLLKLIVCVKLLLTLLLCEKIYKMRVFILYVKNYEKTLEVVQKFFSNHVSTMSNLSDLLLSNVDIKVSLHMTILFYNLNNYSVTNYKK